jgi:hypothetical protein
VHEDRSSSQVEVAPDGLGRADDDDVTAAQLGSGRKGESESTEHGEKGQDACRHGAPLGSLSLLVVSRRVPVMIFIASASPAERKEHFVSG